MVLQINEVQRAALARGAQDRLGDRIAATAGRPDLSPQFRAYVQEALAAGVTLQSDVSKLALLLFEMDKAGPRPRIVSERLADPEVEGELKVFQVDYALRQSCGLVA